jgi:adenylate cyclase
VLAEGTDLHGDELDATILFLDVRDFTSFAESRPPREVVAALNALFDLLVPVILRHGGHANRFLGDGLLAVFGAPTRHPDHAVRAVTAADEMVRLLGGHPTGRLRVGMGINTGRVIAGTIGGGGRRDFTVIGDAVNTAARVEALTRDSDDGVLLTRATFDALPVDLQDGCDARPGVLLRGKSAAVQLYARRTA